MAGAHNKKEVPHYAKTHCNKQLVAACKNSKSRADSEMAYSLLVFSNLAMLVFGPGNPALIVSPSHSLQ